MTIVLAATNENFIKEHIIPQAGDHRLIWVEDANDFAQFAGADAFVDFMGDTLEYPLVHQPLLINQTSKCFNDLRTYPPCSARFCGWPGFAERTMWEIASPSTGAELEKIGELLAALGKDHELVADQPGFVAPRILSTIINEACYAIDEGISTPDEIDSAMKLGTNYPDGPIHWGRKIGAENIFALLTKLADTDKRYQPHPMLKKYLS